jgi:hypothetical protein
MFRSVALLSSALLAAAQDPAQGWLGYAQGVSPSGTGTITRAEAKYVPMRDALQLRHV